MGYLSDIFRIWVTKHKIQGPLLSKQIMCTYVHMCTQISEIVFYQRDQWKRSAIRLISCIQILNHMWGRVNAVIQRLKLFTLNNDNGGWISWNIQHTFIFLALIEFAYINHIFLKMQFKYTYLVRFDKNAPVLSIW